MKNEVIAAPMDDGGLEEYMKHLESLDEAELNNSYLSCKMNFADQLIRMTVHFVVMKKKGFDISHIPGWLQSNFLKIHSKQLLPGVMTTFHGLLFRKISELPSEDQKRLVEGSQINLVVIRDGKTELLKVDPRSLQPHQIRQVFGRGFVRDEAEQVAWIEEYLAKKAKPALTDAPYEVSKKHKKLIVKHPCTFSAKDLARIIELLSE